MRPQRSFLLPVLIIVVRSPSRNEVMQKSANEALDFDKLDGKIRLVHFLEGQEGVERIQHQSGIWWLSCLDASVLTAGLVWNHLASVPSACSCSAIRPFRSFTTDTMLQALASDHNILPVDA
jgi:hypothetical protein